MKRVADKDRIEMKKLRDEGLSFARIGKGLGFAASTIQYHLCDGQKKRAIERATRSPRVWEGEKKYMRKYMADRYNNDKEFRERMKRHSRESWRRNHGKKVGTK